MCSRSLLLMLLLCALAFVEVSSWPTPRLPLIEDNIDLRKCVATRKGNSQYACFLRSKILRTNCFDDNQFVQEKNITKRQPPPTLEVEGVCQFGCTIRPLTMYAWEIEVILGDNDEFFIFEFFSAGRSSLIKVSLEYQKDHWCAITDRDPAAACHFIPTIKEVVRNGKVKFDDVPKDKTIFDENYKDPGTTRKYNAAQYNKVYLESGSRYYVRFRLFRGGTAPKKMFTDFTQLVATLKTSPEAYTRNRNEEVANVMLTACNGQCDAKIYLNTCGQMAQMVYRKKYVSGWSQLTKAPREAFHHNVYDFTQMCDHLPRYNQPDQVFYPYHVETGYEIVAIECLPEHENDYSALAPRIPYAILRNVNGTAMPYNNFKNKYRDKKKVNYQFVEVTCRSKEDICFYCSEPEWNKDTASLPKDLAPMIFTAGQNGSCATLTCPADSLPYYPHTRFTSLEPPRCEHNAEKDAFEWTFSFQPPTQWNRVRRPLERGYCRKKTNCPPFTESMLECPATTAHMPWFTGCVPANYTNVVAPRYYCDNSTKQLYFAISRRILQKPAIGVLCNYDTGLYEAHLPNGQIQTGFTEESWVVCRDKPIRPKFDTYWNHKPEWLASLAGGTAVGVLIPLLLGLSFIGLYYPIAKCVRVQTENTLQPEQVRKKPVEKKKVPTIEATEETTRKRKEDGDEDEPRKKSVDEDYAKVLEARKEMAKRMTEKFVVVDHNKDEKTCRLPTKSEQAKMDEMDRLAECTSETDQTGREVKPIEREAEPEREVKVNRR